MIDSLIQEIDYDSLMLLNRQISGDTSVFISGNPETIVSRSYLDPGNALAAQFLLERFESFGLDARFMNYDPDGQNVIATKTGSLYPDRQYILCAHYDSRPYSGPAPGADDNGSGVCALLEAARISSTQDFPYTLKFIAFDEEEIGLVGSLAYVDTAFFNGDNILGVLNLDMIAWDSNQDNQVSVATNVPSLPLMVDNMTCMSLYHPEFSPHLLYMGASDHFRFWGRSYPAIMTIEDRLDFNAYYHTLNDNFSHINHNYFYNMTRVAVATFLSWAWDLKMDLIHTPLSNTASPESRIVTLVFDSNHPASIGANAPRLYFSSGPEPFEHVNPYYSSQDTFRFIIPAFPYGSSVSYYFAVQDSAGMFVKTLPPGGKGIDPPGSGSAPAEPFKYYILRDTSATWCLAGLPVPVITLDTTEVSLFIQDQGRILDINVMLSIQHTNTWDLDIYLVSPAGLSIPLSTKNGHTFDHYVSTVFDDEAPTFIYEDIPPYSASFKPECPLSQTDDLSMHGLWTLRIINRGYYEGQLTDFCLAAAYSNTDLYVDSSVPVSGDGLSWSSAYSSISEACAQAPSPGTKVFIKPGTYFERLNITSSGEAILPLTTGISIIAPNIIQFPEGTDLTTVDLGSHPGEYYAYLFRSNLLNSGYFLVTGVDDASSRIYIHANNLLSETGSPGDSTRLSCSIGRPVVYRKYSSDPENERVIVDASQDTLPGPVLYIGDLSGDVAYNVLAADYNLIDGIDITGATEGEGICIQNSSFNIIQKSRIYENNGAGIQILGNGDHPACNNLILYNEIYNVSYQGISIGRGGMPQYENHAHFNHLISNEVYAIGTIDNAYLQSALQINNYNCGNNIRENYFHDIILVASNSAACEIHPHANQTKITANHFRNIGLLNPGVNAVISLNGNNINTEIFNNILSDSIPGNDDLYAFNLDGSNTDSCRVVHNTIYNIDRGFLMQDYSTLPDIDIQNNIVYISDEYFINMGVPGRFNLSHNLYLNDPTPDSSMAYFGETGRQIGVVEFEDPGAGDFRLLVESDPVLCAGTELFPAVALDPDRNLRFADAPDMGAYELNDKYVWEGTIDNNWYDGQNWSTDYVPGSNANIVIDAAVNMPVISYGTVICRGIFLMEGASLKVTGSGLLRITGVE
jgi:hypothetical protein